MSKRNEIYEISIFSGSDEEIRKLRRGPKVIEENQKQIQNRRGYSTVSKIKRFFKAISEDGKGKIQPEQLSASSDIGFKEPHKRELTLHTRHSYRNDEKLLSYLDRLDAEGEWMFFKIVLEPTAH